MIIVRYTFIALNSIMDTLRILTLRHYLMLPDSTITLITGVIDQYIDEELNRGDIAYFSHLLFPIEREQLTTFRDLNEWLRDYGTVIYKYSKTSICTKIYRKLKKLCCTTYLSPLFIKES